MNERNKERKNERMKESVYVYMWHGYYVVVDRWVYSRWGWLHTSERRTRPHASPTPSLPASRVSCQARVLYAGEQQTWALSWPWQPTKNPSRPGPVSVCPPTLTQLSR